MVTVITLHKFDKDVSSKFNDLFGLKKMKIFIGYTWCDVNSNKNEAIFPSKRIMSIYR